jgi:photosystem II stability/assembly factor-like uncharacterized protein
MNSDSSFPKKPENRPGLPEISYRISDYAAFRQRLLARLPNALRPPVGEPGEAPLARLTSRAEDDPAIALLDAWAVVADVLTFYQERIANEAYLRTATERRSVLELARAIGYELNPGVAASAYLTFSVEAAPNSPRVATIPKGTQIMSVPGPGELPQTFETSVEFTAYRDWNAIKPRSGRPQVIRSNTRQLYLSGTKTQLKVGDNILLIEEKPELRSYLLNLTEVIEDNRADYTLVRWQQYWPLEAPPDQPLYSPQVFAFRQKALLFGHNAPPWETMPAEIKLAALEDQGESIQGGVFCSRDIGITWESASTGLPDEDILSLIVKIQPNAQKILFAGTKNKGIFRSEDQGITWEAINKGLTNLDVQVLYVSQEGTLFAGTPNGGVFRSKDNGNNWVPINTGTIRAEQRSETNWQAVNTSLPNTVVRSILVYGGTGNRGTGTVYGTGNTLYGEGTEFSKELKEGDQITLINPTGNLPGRTRIVSQVISDVVFEVNSPFIIDILPSGTEFTAASIIHAAELYADLQVPVVKEVTMNSREVTFTVRSRVPLPGVPSELRSGTLPIPGTIASRGQDVIGSGTAFRWLDGSNDAQLIDPSPVSMSITVEGQTAKTIEDIQSDISLRISQPFTTNTIESGTPFFLQQNITRDYLFVGTDEGIYRSQNYGQDWVPMNADGRDLSNRTIYALLVYPPEGQPTHLFIGTDQGIYRSAENGQAWDGPKEENQVVRSLIVNGDFVFAGTDQGVFRGSSPSTNSWQWTPINRVLNGPIDSEFLVRCSVRSLEIYVSSDDSRYLLAGTDQGIFYTDNSTTLTSGDVVWRPVGGDSLPTQAITALAGRAEIIFAGSEFSGFLETPTQDQAETLASPSSPPQKAEWPGFQIQDPTQIYLDTLYPQILKESWVVLFDDRDAKNPEKLTEPRFAARRVKDIAAVSRRDFSLQGKITRIEPDQPIDPDQFGLRSAGVLARSEPLALAPEPLTVRDRQYNIFQDPLQGDKVYLQNLIQGLQSGQMLIASGRRIQAQLADVGGFFRAKYAWQARSYGLKSLDIKTLAAEIRTPVPVVQEINIDRLTITASTAPEINSACQVGSLITVSGQSRLIVEATSRSNGQITALKIDHPFDPDLQSASSFEVGGTHIFAGTEQGIHRSYNRGQSWSRLTGPGYEAIYALEKVAVEPVPVTAESLSLKGIRITGDGLVDGRFSIGSLLTLAGHSRTVTGVGINDTGTPTELRLNTAFPPTVESVTEFTVGGTYWFVGTEVGLYRSADNGQTWYYLAGLGEHIAYAVIAYSVDTASESVALSISGATVSGTTTSGQGIALGRRLGDRITIAGQNRVVVATTGDNTIIVDAVFETSFEADNVSLISGGAYLFAGTETGLYRSVDQGQTWQALEGLANQPVYALLKLDSTLVAGTDQGVYQSTDHGQHWIFLERLGKQRVHALLVQDDYLFVGTGQGLYRTQNPSQTGGLLNALTWELLDALKGSQIQSLNWGLNYLLAATEQGIYRSLDNGDTWETLDAGLTNANVRAIEVVEPEVFAGTAQGIFAVANQDLRTHPIDWERSNGGLSNTQILSLAIASFGTLLIAGTTEGVFRSVDGGRNWTVPDDGLMHPITGEPLPVQALTAKPQNDQLDLFFAGTPVGVFKSEDGGIHWQLQAEKAGLVYPDIQVIVLNDAELLVGTLQGGVYRSSNNGKTWRPTGLGNTDVQALAVQSSSTLFAGTQRDGVFRSDNNGDTWQQFTETRPGQGTLSSDGKQVFGRGTNFTTQLQPGDTINAAGQTRTVIAIDDSEKQLTLDIPFQPDLKSYTSFTINTGLTNRNITALVVTPNYVFAGTAGSGVFRSATTTVTGAQGQIQAGGERWKQVIANLTDLDIRCLALDDQGILWVGTASGGVFQSETNGEIWVEVNTNLTSVDVRSILVPNSVQNSGKTNLFVGGIGILQSSDGLEQRLVQRQDILQVIAPPITLAVEQNDALTYQQWWLRDEDGFQGNLITPVPEDISLLPAAEDGPVVSEIITVQTPPTDQQLPLLKLQAALKYSYDPNTFSISGNVVSATHGETVEQVLGSGDGNQANQQFALIKLPLTFVSADTPSGNESTLQVRVNGVLWEKADFLYPLHPTDQRYVVRLENDGTTTVTFGDGTKGARLPSGRENIRAVYRSGLGVEGNVGVDRLKLLKTRPLGIVGVTNPLSATGGTGPESLEQARSKAPPTVRTLDRIVSLQDFEDFAQQFTGIGKAQAIALWNEAAQFVHITIAGMGGAEVPTDSRLYTKLVQAIDLARDPIQQVQVDSYQSLRFDVEARLLIDPRYEGEVVEEQVRNTLKAAFAFERRNFGQAVTAAEVISEIQQIEGVVAVDLDALYQTDRSKALEQSLTALTARYDLQAKVAYPAQLLLLNPAGIKFRRVPTL